jgi:hypothetical protein
MSNDIIKDILGRWSTASSAVEREMAGCNVRTTKRERGREGEGDSRVEKDERYK